MKRLLVLLIISVISTVGSAFAHEVLTHQKIGDAAVSYLRQSAPDRPVLPALQQLLVIGAAQEDLDPLNPSSPPVGRYFFHFDPPLTLNSSNTLLTASCAAEEWGLHFNQCFATCFTPNIPFQGACFVAIVTPPQTNAHRWDQNLTLDNSSGAPNSAAIRGFGYVVHLLEDLGSPAHTRNDPHPCPHGLIYCDPFETFNNGSSPNLPTSTFVVQTSSFSAPDDFFSSLQTFVSTNYYSDNTTFAPGMSGPAPVREDLQYFYGACITGVSTATTCARIGGQAVRKIAHKGPLYWASCLGGRCDQTSAGIDSVIAGEQFDELGPVIVQYIASFIQFYSPALTVQVQGTQAGTVSASDPSTGASYSQINNCAGSCTGLFVNANSVTLTANPGPGSIFSGWGQDCSGTATTITVRLTADTTCVANFGPATGGPSITISSIGCNTVSEAGTRIGMVTMTGTAAFDGTPYVESHTSAVVLTGRPLGNFSNGEPILYNNGMDCGSWELQGALQMFDTQYCLFFPISAGIHQTSWISHFRNAPASAIVGYAEVAVDGLFRTVTASTTCPP